MEVCYTDISDKVEFSLNGYRYILDTADESTHAYIYAQTRDGVTFAYEVVKAVKRRNPDGSSVYTYPGESQWGVRGFTCMTREAALRKYNELREDR